MVEGKGPPRTGADKAVLLQKEVSPGIVWTGQYKSLASVPYNQGAVQDRAVKGSEVPEVAHGGCEIDARGEIECLW